MNGLSTWETLVVLISLSGLATGLPGLRNVVPKCFWTNRDILHAAANKWYTMV